MERLHAAPVYAETESAKPIPVLRGLPGIGVALQLHKSPIEFFADTVKRYGDIVELRVLRKRVLLLTNPSDVEAVLIHNAEHFGRSAEVKSLRAVFGDGLYSSEGERWRSQRRVMQPAFHHDRVMRYSWTMVERMRERTGRWRPKESFDVFKEMLGFATDVICEVTFGEDKGANAKVIANSVPIVYENLGPEVLYLSLWRKLPLPRSRRWNRAVKDITTSVYSMIAERRLQGGDSEDLMGVLLGTKDEHGEVMSDQYVHDEVITMFVAGQETSAVALSWAVALLAQHPEFQEEAAAEIAAVTNGREVTPEDYPRLKFLNAVVQETVRLYPPLWSLGRDTIHDTMVGDVPVDAGTKIWICVQRIHRDPRWFSDPDSFQPHRWSDGSRRPKFSYFPFGGGSRSCVAQHFAMAELVLGLAVMLSRFRFRLAPGAKIETDAWLTLRPKNGVPVVVEAR
ncbi:cytochrome P450 [Granulicella sp. dw_53]|uniref:cytochrome P450 n=1 Tax=Granulicella sp. dw_53 TaxID=2719792 RepID=UPI001BD541CA|nr:cytochrome P450 [Granulicella sp. dw_53]